jgi:hypothetical protein
MFFVYLQSLIPDLLPPPPLTREAKWEVDSSGDELEFILKGNNEALTRHDFDRVCRVSQDQRVDERR